MARPRSSEDERRSECFAIRLTPGERLALQDAAERFSMSPTELARQRLTKGRVVVHEHRQLDPRQVFELGKIGVNLNQIARALNSRQNINPATIESAIAELKKLIASLLLDGGPDAPKPGACGGGEAPAGRSGEVMPGRPKGPPGACRGPGSRTPP
jgi:Mobilization protein NikA